MTDISEYMAKIDVLIEKGILQPEHRELARLAHGDGVKKPHAEELEVARAAQMSVVTIADIEQGELFTDANIAIKRPGTGIPANAIEDVKGYTAACKMSNHHVLQWSEVA